jgi:hypothetical protein
MMMEQAAGPLWDQANRVAAHPGKDAVRLPKWRLLLTAMSPPAEI